MSIKFPSVRLIIAGAVAVIADIVQLLLIPFFSEFGIVNPINDILDAGVALVMVCLLGFHWTLMPSALGKLVPVANLMPLWTGAVFFIAVEQHRAANAPADGTSGGTVPHILSGLMPTLPISAQSALPPASSSASPKPESMSSNSLNPFFKETESK